ncbi:MAG: hypothetical protein FK732_09695 [Asgard group archaeon]|nr:hypothetical protein [Asgard group archaeon]
MKVFIPEVGIESCRFVDTIRNEACNEDATCINIIDIDDTRVIVCFCNKHKVLRKSIKEKIAKIWME